MSENRFVHIRSSKFSILPDEDTELVNEGTYGKALAQYLQQRLDELGYETPFVCCEDWGWWVEIKGQPFTLGLCIYGMETADDSLDLCFQVSAAPERRWSWTQLKFIDRAPRVEQLNHDLKDIVESDSAIEVLGYTEAFPI